MHYPRYERDHGWPASHTAIFLDYENLYGLLNDRLQQGAYPDEYITEMLDELRRSMLEEAHSPTTLVIAYADFSALHGNGSFIQRALYLQGAEPRFVPATLQRDAVEMQLCTDAMDVLHTRPDVRTFILMTGDRAYLPLVQQLKRYGRDVRVVTLENPPATESMQYAEGTFYLDALQLLSDASRREVRPPASDANGYRSSGAAPGTATAPRYLELHDPAALETLHIIEEHFGQYEEVYLTPLLRKLSELLDEQEHDPKALISELEEARAVRLEKRRGFPYDYTVLIVEQDHPDVLAVQQHVNGHATGHHEDVDDAPRSGAGEEDLAAFDAPYEEDTPFPETDQPVDDAAWEEEHH